MEQPVACSANFILGLKERYWIVSERGVSSFELTLAAVLGSGELVGGHREQELPGKPLLLVSNNCLRVKAVPRETFGQQKSMLSWLRTKGVSVLPKPLVCSG